MDAVVRKRHGNSKNDFNEPYDGVRRELIDLLGDLDNRNILDVGCYRGMNSRYIKSKFSGTHYTGLEIDPVALANSVEEADEVLNVELDNFNPNILHRKFDAVIIGDVLEHLKSPDSFLKALHHCIEPNAKIVVCIPNIQFYETFILLLFGRFPRRRRGIFDATHLRFFTKREFEIMIPDCFRIVGFKRVYRLVEGEYWSALNRLTTLFLPILKIMAPFFTFQMIFVLTTQRNFERSESRKR